MDTFTHKLLNALELNSSQIKELYIIKDQFSNLKM